MKYSVYDKECNEFTNNLSINEVIEQVKYIVENEEDRASFYEFEDENGNKYDCWDINNKFNLGVF